MGLLRPHIHGYAHAGMHDGTHHVTWHIVCHVRNETPGWVGLGFGTAQCGSRNES